MKTKLGVLVAISMLTMLVAGSAAAEKPAPKDAKAAPAPAGPPAPHADFVEFGKLFTGTLNCEAKWNAGPFGPAHPGKGTVTFKQENPFLISSHYLEDKAGNPMAWDVMELYSHDGVQFHRVGYDSFGGMVHGMAAKWENNKLVFAGEMTPQGAKKGPATITFTKKGAKEIGYQLEMTGPDGKVMDLGSGTCK